jgi:hypothetical protein
VRELVDPGQQIARGVPGAIGLDRRDPGWVLKRAAPETK